MRIHLHTVFLLFQMIAHFKVGDALALNAASTSLGGHLDLQNSSTNTNK